MAKRQTGNLHDLHIRIQDSDYAKVQMICQKLDITIADYFNQLLTSDGYDTLLRYAKIICKDPRIVEIRFTDETMAEKVSELKDAINVATTQTRKLGSNVSALIRDIRLGKVSAQQAIPTLEEIERLMVLQKANYQTTGGKLEDILFSEDGIQKVEIREKYRMYRTDDDVWSEKDIPYENGGDN